MITLSESVRYVGETILGVRFRTDPDAARERIPDPLTPIRAGDAFCYFGEAVIEDPSIVAATGHLPPRLSTLYESAVVLPCELDGREGCFFAGHHADRDWSTRKFRSMGYDSELADVRLTRFPAELREFVAPGAGTVVQGETTADGETRMRGEARLETDDTGHPWPFALTVFGRRRLADPAADGDGLLVDDVTTETHASTAMPTVWAGEGDLSLHEEYFGDLRPVEVTGGYLFDISLEFEGMTVLWEGDGTEG